MISLMWNLRNKKTKKQTLRHREQTGGCQRGGGQGMGGIDKGD